MLVADDDDDVLEYADSQARAAAANLPKADESETPGEPELEGELIGVSDGGFVVVDGRAVDVDGLSRDLICCKSWLIKY